MSYHYPNPELLTHTVQQVRQKQIKSRVLYLSSTPIPVLQRLILVNVAVALFNKTPWQASQVRMGELFDRSPRSIRRAMKDLALAGLVRIKRRGRKLTNVYLLARRLWHTLTNGAESQLKRLQQRLFSGGWQRKPIARLRTPTPEKWRAWAEAHASAEGSCMI